MNNNSDSDPTKFKKFSGFGGIRKIESVDQSEQIHAQTDAQGDGPGPAYDFETYMFTGFGMT